jgi:signal transduction histidine kinase
MAWLIAVGSWRSRWGTTSEWRSGQTEPDCRQRQFGPAVDAEFLVDVLDVAAQAQNVLVSISYTDARWQFLVNDDGKGFDTSVALGNGINNLRARAADIGADIEWQSENDLGITVRVTLTLG